MGYRRSMALRPVNRIKHVVDNSFSLAANTVLDVQLVTARDAPVLANPQEIVTGSKVYGIYLRVEVASDEVADVGAIPNVYMAVFKNPGDNLALIQANAVGANDNKRFVIHQEMLMIENTGRGGNPRVLFNGVIKIPRGFSRFGPNDRLEITFISPAINFVGCLQCHYKEFR